VRVVLVNFGERHDIRSYTVADRWPTNQVSAWQAGRGTRRTRQHPREDLREDVGRVWRVGEDVTRTLR